MDRIRRAGARKKEEKNWFNCNEQLKTQFEYEK